KNPSFCLGGGRLNCLTLRKIILLKTVKGFCCLMQEIKNGIDRTHRSLVRQSLAANIAPDFERNLKYDNLYNRLQKKQSAEGQKRPPKQRFREGGGDVGKAPAV
ncbi:hypothetical protein, partial [Alistipes communis]|uniref:hypothetical protein n=1 Tax=Alistipes communis TaxID=2585118 RepID=UPI003A87CD4C